MNRFASLSLSLSSARVNELGRKWAEFYPRFYGAGLNREEEEGEGVRSIALSTESISLLPVCFVARAPMLYLSPFARLFVCFVSFFLFFFFFLPRYTCALGDIIIKQGSVEHLSSGGLIKLFRIG